MYLLTLGLESLPEWVRLARDARAQGSELIYLGSGEDLAAIRESGVSSDFGGTYELSGHSFDDVHTAIKAFFLDAFGGRQVPVRDVRIATYDESLMPVCAEVRHRYGIAGESAEDIDAYIDKAQMRTRVPCEYLVDGVAFSGGRFDEDPEQFIVSLLDRLGLPLVAKPTSMTGSRGVKKIQSAADLRDWCVANRSQPGMLFEEFVQGT